MIFLKEFTIWISNSWKKTKIYQRFIAVFGMFFLFAIFVFLFFKATSDSYVPVFAEKDFSLTEAARVKQFLDESKIKYKIESDTAILVPDYEVHRIRMDLAAEGIPESDSGGGFELFDANTWIKGEKELQVLEMRALKGELERDISEYDNVEDVSVILDIAPPRPFGGEMYKTKASVILDLRQGTRLKAAQLKAIGYHLSGAVRGLQPNMVAISDTTGRLYQGMGTSENFDVVASSETALEERLKEKVDGILTMIVGDDNFYSTVQININRENRTEEIHFFDNEPDNEVLVGAWPVENRRAAGHIKRASKPGQINNISISVLVDKTVHDNDSNPQETFFLRDEIENQLAKIMEGYGLKAVPAIDFVEFNKVKKTAKPSVPEKQDDMLIVYISIVVLVASVVLWVTYLLKRRK
jgi:flagellar M-ring protein FliF